MNMLLPVAHGDLVTIAMLAGFFGAVGGGFVSPIVVYFARRKIERYTGKLFGFVSLTATILAFVVLWEVIRNYSWLFVLAGIAATIGVNLESPRLVPETPNKAPEPTTTSVMPRANEGEAK